MCIAVKAEVGLPPDDGEGKVTLSWRASVVPGGGGDNNSTPLLHFALPHHQVENTNPGDQVCVVVKVNAFCIRYV